MGFLELVCSFSPLDVDSVERYLRSTPLDPSDLSSTKLQSAMSSHPDEMSIIVHKCATWLSSSDDGGVFRSNCLFLLTKTLVWFYPSVCGGAGALPSSPRALRDEGTNTVNAVVARCFVDILETLSRASASLDECPLEFLDAIMINLVSQEAAVARTYCGAPGCAWEAVTLTALGSPNTPGGILAQKILCWMATATYLTAPTFVSQPFSVTTFWNRVEGAVEEIINVQHEEGAREPWSFHLLCFALRDGWFDAQQLSTITPTLLQVLYYLSTNKKLHNGRFNKYAQAVFGSCVFTLLHCSSVKAYVGRLRDTPLDGSAFDAAHLNANYGVPLDVAGKRHEWSVLDLTISVVCQAAMSSSQVWAQGQWLEPLSMIIYNLSWWMRKSSPYATLCLLDFSEHCVFRYETTLLSVSFGASSSPSSSPQQSLPLEVLSTKPLRNIFSAVSIILHHYTSDHCPLLCALRLRRDAIHALYTGLMENTDDTDTVSAYQYPFDPATRRELASRLLPWWTAAEIASDAVQEVRDRGSRGPSFTSYSSTMVRTDEDVCSDMDVLREVSLVGMLPCEEVYIPQAVHTRHWEWHADAVARCVKRDVFEGLEKVWGRKVSCGGTSNSCGITPEKMLKSITSDVSLDVSIEIQ